MNHFDSAQYRQKGSPRLRFGEAGIAHLVLVITTLLLLAGIGIGLYLVQHPAIFKPRAEQIQTNPGATQIPSLRSITINTTEYDTRISGAASAPFEYYIQPGWEKSEFVPFMKSKIDQARQIGFNTVWLVFPWQRPIPNNSLLNQPAMDNLKQLISYAQSKNMYVILPMVYCHAGWCWGGNIDSYQLATADSSWQKYQDYSKAFVAALKDYPNVHYLLFSENLRPFEGVLRDPNYPSYRPSFANYLKTRSSDVNYFNSRWGTSFGSWDEVLPPPNNLAGANSNYIEDYYLWTAYLIKNRLGQLAADLRNIKNPQSTIGYHDFIWAEVGRLGAESPIPSQNPYDFLSVGMYPSDWANPVNYQTQPDMYMQKLAAYRNRYPDMPIFIGELGADTNSYRPDGDQYNKQSYFINEILNKSKGKIFGFNIWQLIEYNDPVYINEGKFGLIKLDGTWKQPTVDVLRNNFLRPTISATGISTDYNPWAVWMTGENLSTDLIYVVKDQGPIWLDYQKIAANKQGNNGSFQLPKNSPPSNCNLSSVCNLQLTLWDPIANLTSNTANLALPNLSQTASPSPNPSVQPSPSPSPSPLNSTAQISASPNPCILTPEGRCKSTITWSSTNAQDFKITIKESPGSLFTSSPNGSGEVDWITAPGATFEAYSGSNLLASLNVRGIKLGDLNADGNVTLADFNAFARNYRDKDLKSDFNGNGGVDLADLNLLIRNFGK